ncbi:signal peptide peptidase SppA [Candidatus Woesearchaeota archaeon]|nr:signal peptide peptidase SppA [Candidatus Woesearchaeota archaeon]
MKDNSNGQKPVGYMKMLWILLLFFIFASILAGIASMMGDDNTLEEGNVAVIQIKGTITGEEPAAFFDTGIVSSSEVMDLIKEVEEAPNIKAVVLEINSPGGLPVASQEIMQAVKDLDMPTVAWIRESGASGAYWIATGTDHIIANPLSIVGSVGVIGSYLEYPNLLTRFNISYVRLVGGEKKDIGIPFRSIEELEQDYLQEKVDKLHEYFWKSVAENRGIDDSKMKSLATGEYWLGEEALELGLVDELGGRKELLAYLKDELDEEPVLVTVRSEKSLLESLGLKISDRIGMAIGQGIGKTLFSKEENPLRT